MADDVFLAIPKLPKMKTAATEMIRRVLEYNRCKPDTIDGIENTLVQGINQAFEHGRPGNRTVCIRLHLGDDGPEITVQDREPEL